MCLYLYLSTKSSTCMYMLEYLCTSTCKYLEVATFKFTASIARVLIVKSIDATET